MNRAERDALQLRLRLQREISEQLWASIYHGAIEGTEERSEKWFDRLFSFAAVNGIEIMLVHDGRGLYLDGNRGTELDFRTMDDLEVEVAWERFQQAVEYRIEEADDE